MGATSNKLSKILMVGMLVAGAAFAWKAYERRERLIAYDACVERFTKTARDQADLNAKMAMCQMQYTGQLMATGLYGSSPGRAVSLAMTKRPDI